MIIDVFSENIDVQGEVEINLPSYMSRTTNPCRVNLTSSKIIAIGRQDDDSDIVLITGDGVPRIISVGSLVPSGKIVLHFSCDYITVLNDNFVRGYCVISAKNLITNSHLPTMTVQI